MASAAGDEAGEAAGAVGAQGAYEVCEILRPAEEPLIERLIVRQLVALHSHLQAVGS